MNLFPKHVPPGDWLQNCYDELERRSLESGVTLEEAREGAALASRLKDAIAHPASAEVIPFPVRRNA